MKRAKNRALKPCTPAPRSGASTGVGERVSAWRDLHLYSLFSSFGRIAQRPWATALTVGVMAVALALPLGLLLALSGLETLAGGVRESRDISVFLDPSIDVAAAGEQAAALRQREDVAAVAVRTPEEGLIEFRELAEFSGALAVLDYNPLPSVLVVSPAAGADTDGLATALAALPGADFVQDDAAWRERLAAWLAFGHRAVAVVALLLGIGALLVVGNTVRLDIQTRAEEIAIVQLLGATDGFVRRPFLYLGAWYGLAAGVLAVLLVTAAGLALAGPLATLTASYGGQAPLPLPDLRIAAATVAVAALLGWLGAGIAAGHHLRATRPVVA